MEMERCICIFVERGMVIVYKGPLIFLSLHFLISSFIPSPFPVNGRGRMPPLLSPVVYFHYSYLFLFLFVSFSCFLLHTQWHRFHVGSRSLTETESVCMFSTAVSNLGISNQGFGSIGIISWNGN